MATSPFDRAEIERARPHLEQLGYRIELRHDTWWECRVSMMEEEFIGRGDDADEAFAHALAAIFPSRAARLALRDVLGFSGRRKSLPADAPSQPPTLQPPATPSDEVTRQRPALTATPEFSLDAPTIELPVVSAPEASEPADKTRLDTPAQDATTVQVATLADSDATRPPTVAADVLRDLEELRFRVLTIEPEIALMAPQLQRLHLLGWMARARALEETLPPAPPIEFATGAVVALLGRMARAFWVGTIKALARTATPAASAEDLHTEKTPSTWEEVATLAAETLDALAGGARGLDEYGWSDASSASPPPADPDAMLERISAVCERAERTLDGSSAPGTADAELAAALCDAARRARWLRGNTSDDVAWGTTIGTLRRIVAHHPAGLEEVSKLIDPAHAPAESWLASIGGEAAARTDAPSSDDSSPLLTRVRERISGRRMLFVGHREDAQLQGRLEHLFRLGVEWCTADAERVQGQAERIRRGAYDFVLSATGFRSLAADRELSEACRAASVPLIRVDHPRPLACARALARELAR